MKLVDLIVVGIYYPKPSNILTIVSSNTFTITTTNNDQILDAVGFLNNLLEQDDKVIIKKDIIYRGNTFSNVLVMYNCTFEGKVEFIDCTFDKEVSIKNCTFDKEVSFENSKFKSKVSFKNSTFESKVSFTGCTFNKKVSFKNSTFKSKVSFENSTFCETVNYDNTTFENLVYFYEVIFKKNQKFAFTDFLDRAFFSKVIFESQIQFIYNKVKPDTIISFVDTKFKQLLDISRANFLCRLHFWNITIKLNFSNISLYKNDKVEDKVEDKEEDKEEDKVRALKKIRESFRIIKHEFRKAGNNIEALEFQKKEMFTYEEELGSNGIIARIKNFFGKNFWTRIKNFLYDTLRIVFSPLIMLFSADRIMLFFNRLSNNFGTSWSRGVVFTLIISIAFYSFYLYNLPLKLDISCNGFFNTLNNFFHFINITDWSFKPFGIEDSSKSYWILFISRIFIGYGYYQTIQAFRKFGKN